MKTTITLIILLFAFAGMRAQAPNWAWAKNAGKSSNDFDFATNVTTDVNGNVFICGSFLGPAITFGAYTLTNVDSTYPDVYIVKYDPSGNVLWAKGAGSSDYDYATGICTDRNGNVYITGMFGYPSITFGNFTMYSDLFGAHEAPFVVKMDPNGNVIWAKNPFGLDDNWFHSISISASNEDLYIAGTVGNYIIFDTAHIALDTTYIMSSGITCTFLARYDTAGNFSWVKKSEGTTTTETSPYNVINDKQENSIVTGTFHILPVMGNPPITIFENDTLYNVNDRGDIFLVKYDSSGNLKWAKSAGGTGDDFSLGVVTDINGFIYITGLFRSPSITFGNTTLTNSSAGNIFVAKYDPLGNVVWAKRAGGNYSEAAYSIAIDADANLYITGIFQGIYLDFGNVVLNNTSPMDLFVAKYDSSGNVLWAKSSGGSGLEYGTCIAVDTNANVFVTGLFDSPTISFDGTNLTRTADTTDIFIARINAIPLGTPEVEIQHGFSIAPNPFTSQTILYFDAEQNNTCIKLFDILGNEIRTARFSGRQYLLEKGALSNGIYFVQVRNEKNEVFTRKLIMH